MSSPSVQFIKDQIQAIQEEILKTGATPLRFRVSDKMIDNTNHLADLKKQLVYWESQLQIESGQSPLQGPDLEIY